MFLVVLASHLLVTIRYPPRSFSDAAGPDVYATSVCHLFHCTIEPSSFQFAPCGVSFAAPKRLSFEAGIPA